MSLRNKAIAGIKWTGLSAFIIAVLRFAQVITLARYLNPIDFGLMAMALIVIDITLANLDLGVSAGIIHHQDATGDELSSLYWMNVFTGGVIFTGFLLGRSVISALFNEPRLTDILFWVSTSFLITPFGSQFRVLLQRDLRFNILAKQEMAGKLCETVVAVVLAIKGYGIWSLVIGYLIGGGVSTILVVALGLKYYRPALHFKFPELRKYLSFGIYQMGTRTIGLFSDKVDQILIGTMLGTQNLGYYSFAYNISNQPIARITPVLMRVLFPIFSKTQHDAETLKRAYLKVLKYLMYVITPLAMGLAVIAGNWVVPIFGQKWEGSVLLVQILAVLSIFRGPGKTYGSLILSKGKANLLFNWTAVSTLLRLMILYIGGRLFGIVGVASSLLLLQAAIIVPSYYYFVKPFLGNCIKEYLVAILKPMLLGSLMAGGVLIGMHFSRTSLAYLVRDVCLGGGLYSLLLYTFDRGFTSDLKKVVYRQV